MWTLAELAVPGFDPEEVRRITDEVLARPGYAEVQPGLVAQFWDAALDLVGRLLEAVTGSGEQGVVGGLVVLAIVAVAVVLVVRFVSGVRRDPGLALALSGAVGRPAQDWAAEAEGHERAGRHREALRCRYRYLIAALAAQGLVDEVPGRTTGEYLSETSAAVPGAGRELRGVTTAFERVWYGDADADADAVTAARSDVDAVLAAARGERVAARSGAS